MGMEYDLPRFRTQLAQSFNLDEIKDACFELGVDYEELSGDTKSGRIRELLTYLKRRDSMGGLIAYCVKIRPTQPWDFVKSQAEQQQEFVQGLNLPDSFQRRYLDSKFERYMRAWQLLTELRNSGNELWQQASQENLINFSHVLKNTQAFVETNAPLFSSSDYAQLQCVLNHLGAFRVGKGQLIQLREGTAKDDETNLRYLSTYGGFQALKDEIQGQIRKNGNHKHDYEALMDQICVDFRRQIEAMATPNESGRFSP